MRLTVEDQSQPYQPAVDDVSEGTARRPGDERRSARQTTAGVPDPCTILHAR